MYITLYQHCNETIWNINETESFRSILYHQKSISLTFFHAFVQWNVSWNCFEHSHEHITTNPNNQPTLLTSTQLLKSYNYWRGCSGRGFLQIMCVPSRIFKDPWKTIGQKKTYEILNPRLDTTPCSSMVHDCSSRSAQPSYCWWRLKSGVNSPVEGTVVYHIRFTGLLAPSQVVLIPGFLKHQQYLVGGFNPVEKY